MQVTVPSKVTHEAKSIFKHESIETLICAHRHWIQSELIHKSAFNAEKEADDLLLDGIEMPSFGEVFTGNDNQ